MAEETLEKILGMERIKDWIGLLTYEKPGRFVDRILIPARNR